MLSPETATALSEALDAVLQEVADDPTYADLAEALESAQSAIQDLPDAPEGEGDEAPEDEAPEGDADEDEGDAAPESFEEAQAQFTKRRKKAKGAEAPAADEGEDE